MVRACAAGLHRAASWSDGATVSSGGAAGGSGDSGSGLLGPMAFTNPFSQGRHEAKMMGGRMP